MGSVARAFGTDAEGFIFGFSVFVNILMEVTRLFLAFVTGRGIADALRRAEAPGSAPVSARAAEPVSLAEAPRGGSWTLKSPAKKETAEPMTPASEAGEATQEGEGGRYGLLAALAKARAAVQSGALQSSGQSAIRKATGFRRL